MEGGVEAGEFGGCWEVSFEGFDDGEGGCIVSGVVSFFFQWLYF